jgi:hypothetical protein
MGCLEGSGVPVLYIGRTVPKGEHYLFPSSTKLTAQYQIYVTEQFHIFTSGSDTVLRSQ